MIDKLILLVFSGLFTVTPLVMNSLTSELFEFNKMIFIYLSTVVALFLWLLKMILHKKTYFRNTFLDWPLRLFFLSQLISTIFSIDVHTSIFGYYSRFNGGLLSIAAYLILYRVFVSNINPADLKKLLRLSLASSFLVILWGLPGRLGHDLSCLVFMGQFNNKCWTNQFDPAARMFSTLGQPNWLGAYLAINFFIALYFFLSSVDESKKLNQYLFGFYIIINFVSVLFTRSRSALLSVVVGLVLFSVYFYYGYRKNKPKLKITGVLLTCLIISLIIFKTGIGQIDRILTGEFRPPQVNEEQQTRPATDLSSQNQETDLSSDVTESFDIRKIVWQGAVDLGLRYPFFGSGVETFAYSYYFTRPKVHNLTSEWDFLYNKAHNEFLNYLATTGFAGLFFYMAMIAVVIYRFGRTIVLADKDLKKLFFCLLMAYFAILITNFFGFSTTVINLYFYLIPALAVLFDHDYGYAKQRDEFPASLNQKIAVGVLSAVFIYGVYFIASYWLADINYARGDNYGKLGDYRNAVDYLSRALKLRYEHVYLDKLSYNFSNLAVVAHYQKQSELAKQLITVSDQYNLKSLEASPKNILYWKTRAKNQYLYYQITLNPEQINEGIAALKKAEVIASTDPKVPYTLAIFHSLLADETKEKNEKRKQEELSLQDIDRSIGLKANFRDGYLLKGQLLKKYGNKEKAREIFSTMLDKFNPKDEEVLEELKEN
ncbi:O-antigen ligase family protein [Candidatus Roizmanbacteria bacterium]|nr:O-antigen ligase family protein [Candidatus Roizmanbacteria bacterium]